MLTLGGHPLKLPILQGGMGVGVSLGGLAGAVAACGGMGCVSAADTGFNEPGFAHDPDAANLSALQREIVRAHRLADGHGMVAANIMVASRQYADAVRAAVDAEVDAIVSGAGLPLELPGLVERRDVALAPIVSSGRAARLIAATWKRRFDRLPDFVVVEGARAGGHLGFEEAALLSGACQPLEELIPEVVQALAPFGDIPVFAAGGIYTAEDVRRFRALGAAGVQLATRFIATYECDASDAFKQTLLNASDEDVRIIHSPVGMPGRALRTPLIERLEQGKRYPPTHCVRCLYGCDPATVPYCITRALIEAVRGSYEDGLFFCGANVGRLDRMCHVSDIMDELKPGFEG